MVIVLAERDRDYRTAAHAEHVGERHQQDEDRVGQADGGYLQGIAGLSDEKVSAMLYTTVTRLLMTLGIAIAATARGIGALPRRVSLSKLFTFLTLEI